MKYYRIDPEVPGRLSPETLRAIRCSPPEDITYIFECDPSDDIVQADPVFLVSASLSGEIYASKLTGAELHPCICIWDEQMIMNNANLPPPPTYQWLKVSGIPRVDDFGVGEGLMLVVSERALNALRGHRIEGCDVLDA